VSKYTKQQRQHEHFEHYHWHKYSARNRNIPFLLTFDEWLKEWEDSGHLHERGCRKGQYCMARFGDQGPYAIGNVKIILHTQNIAERVITDAERERTRQRNLSRDYKTGYRFTD
jgi:hypothetical protein